MREKGGDANYLWRAPSAIYVLLQATSWWIPRMLLSYQEERDSSYSKGILTGSFSFFFPSQSFERDKSLKAKKKTETRSWPLDLVQKLNKKQKIGLEIINEKEVGIFKRLNGKTQVLLTPISIRKWHQGPTETFALNKFLQVIL